MLSVVLICNNMASVGFKNMFVHELDFVLCLKVFLRILINFLLYSLSNAKSKKNQMKMHITYRPETKFLITTSNVLIFTNSGSETPCRRKKQHYLCKELSSTLVIFTIFNVPSNTPGIVFCIQCNV